MYNMKHQQMQQKFVFKPTANYIGELLMKHNIVTDEWWASTLKINLSSINHQINHDRTNTDIKDDQDAINRVIYNLNHEYLHLAQHMSGHHNSLEQEYHIYNMIGNGGSEYFNEYYQIEQNPVIDQLTK